MAKDIAHKAIVVPLCILIGMYVCKEDVSWACDACGRAEDAFHRHPLQLLCLQ